VELGVIEGYEGKMIRGVMEWIDRECLTANKRGLILVNSHRLRKLIVENWKEKTGEECLPNNDGSTLIWDWDYNKAVQLFKELYDLEPDTPYVLISTVGTGIDLPGKECEALCIPKVPWPGMQDPWTAARLKQDDGWPWMAAQTAQEITQMTGRVIRNVSDKATIDVMDASFVDFLHKNHGIVPEWFKEAIRVDGFKIKFGEDDDRPSKGKFGKSFGKGGGGFGGHGGSGGRRGPKKKVGGIGFSATPRRD